MFASEITEGFRNDIVKIRHTMTELGEENDWCKYHLGHVAGLMTCALVTLARSVEEMKKKEIAIDDDKRGKHKSFVSRGIGMDGGCKACFVCGAEQRKPGGRYYLHNISAYVKSKKSGDEIAAWFREGAAWVDFRDYEPNYIQLKVGACEKHLKNLEDLHQATRPHNVIRERDINDAIKQ